MKPYSLLFLGGWGISLLVSCAAEEDALYAKDAAQGRIVLSMPQLEPFLEVRAELTLTDFSGYTFTLKGTNSDGWTVNETLQLQKEGKQYSCIIPAGNYTLTADNATAAVALKQIEEKGYALPYAADSRKLFKVGISFSSETGTVNDFDYVSVLNLGQ